MSLNEELELSPQAKTQAAYDNAPRIEFNASNLEPWTIQRHSLSMTLGCQVMTAIGPSVSAFLSRGTYPNLFRDVIIVLWLSSLDVKRLNELDCHPNLAALMSEAYAWAEANEIRYASENYVAGVEIIDAIIQGILASAFSTERSVEESETDKKKGTAAPGKSKCVSSQRKHPAKSQSTFLK